MKNSCRTVTLIQGLQQVPDANLVALALPGNFVDEFALAAASNAHKRVANRTLQANNCAAAQRPGDFVVRRFVGLGAAKPNASSKSNGGDKKQPLSSRRSGASPRKESHVFSIAAME